MDRRRLRLGALATLVALLVRPTGSGAQASPAVVPSKFDAQGFVQFLIPVTVNGERFWCSLDSGGSWVFSMDAVRARQAGFQPNSSGSIAGAGPEVRRDERVTGVTATIGPLQLPSLTIVMVPLPAIAPDMECIFGLGILQDYIAPFDYRTPELRLFTRDGFQPSPRAVAIPFEIDRFRNPFMTATVRLQDDDTATARLMLDTGASYYSVVFGESFARANGIRARLRRVVPQATHTPGLTLSAARIDALRIGPFEPRATIAALLDTPSGVDRQPASPGIDLGEIKDRLSNAGATVRPTLERNGVEHRVTLTLKELL